MQTGGRGHLRKFSAQCLGRFKQRLNVLLAKESEKSGKSLRHCSGRGVIKKHDEFTVKIPAGDDGEAIHLSGRGKRPQSGYPVICICAFTCAAWRVQTRWFDLHMKECELFSGGFGWYSEIDLDGKINCHSEGVHQASWFASKIMASHLRGGVRGFICGVLWWRPRGWAANRRIVKSWGSSFVIAFHYD